MNIEYIPRGQLLDFVDIDIYEGVREQLLIDIGDWQEFWGIRYITNGARCELDFGSNLVVLQ